MRNENHTRLYLYTRHTPSPTTAIILTHPNPFRDSLRSSQNDIGARKCVDIACELYRRNIWTDDRTVALLATATLSPNTSIMTRAIHFFLGIESVMDEDKEREENDEWEGVNDIDFHQHSRKTKKRQNQVLKQIANRKKAQMRREKKKMEDGMEENTPNLYPAIEQLNNPQGLAEKLLKKIKNSASNAYKFDQKLTILNFGSYT